MKIAFTVQYNGSGFIGFQRQKTGRTLQAELEAAFKTVLREKIRVHVAGRTDTGVHAAGQVIHIQLTHSPKPDLHKLIYAINSLLPLDVSIIHGAFVPDTFHARFSCLGREYLFKITNTPYRQALLRANTHWVRFSLDLKAMQQAAALIVGEHDFAAFTPVFYRKNDINTIRRLDAIHIIEQPPMVLLHFIGSGFLHNMIRVIAGTLIEVGVGKRPPESMAKILHGLDRVESGVTLPPNGLTFLRAHYRDYAAPLELIPDALSMAQLTQTTNPTKEQQ